MELVMGKMDVQLEVVSSAENQKGVNTVQRCSGENQKGAIEIDFLKW